MPTLVTTPDRFTKILPMPYGKQELDPNVNLETGTPRRVRCYVRGCHHVLRVPTKYDRGETCPDHGIRCHCSGSGAAYSHTYTYADAKRNVIASAEQFGQRIIHHPFKYESHRLGSEKSEDTLTWNVFRSLQEAGQLGSFVERVTGERSPLEPYLYLWGICLTDDEFEPWPLLIAARDRFERALPVKRPFTEPDIALHLPGKYLILIEAKFTSPNTCYEPGPRKDAASLTFDELLGRYQDPGLEILDYRAARQAARVYQQLWRNTTFAEWMGKTDHPRTKAYHLNLVRDGEEIESEPEFRKLVSAQFQDRFRRITWEQIYHGMGDCRRLEPLRQYLANKTAGLRPAFRLPRT